MPTLCAGLPRTELIRGAHRRYRAADGRFDIVHSCHTIEHLAEPFAALKDHARVLKPGGLLVIDAPNIALIGGDDIVEEWFIDKHLYHFSARTLSRMIEAAGFDHHRSSPIRPTPSTCCSWRARPTPPHDAIAADPAEVARSLER